MEIKISFDIDLEEVIRRAYISGFKFGRNNPRPDAVNETSLEQFKEMNRAIAEIKRDVINGAR